MSPHREYRHLLLRLGQSSLAREERRLTIRESLDTVVLGALSTAVGILVLMVMRAGMRGVLVRGYLEHTGAWGVAAMIGEFLGLTGLVLARRRNGAIAPLSLVGTVLCLSHFLLFFWIRP
jgi:hypothetical protein